MISLLILLIIINDWISIINHYQEYCRNRPEDMRGPYELQPKVEVN